MNWVPKFSCWHGCIMSTRVVLAMIMWGVNTLCLWHDSDLNVSFFSRGFYGNNFRPAWWSEWELKHERDWILLKADKDRSGGCTGEVSITWMDFSLSSGTWEATNKQFFSHSDLSCQALLTLLLRPVKWLCPFSSIVFPTAIHPCIHVSTHTTHHLLIKMPNCFTKATHSSSPLPCENQL